jgi:gas vesicle protein
MSENKGGFSSFLAGLFLGGLLGGAIAILAAPRSGEETREQIRAKGVELRDTAEQTANEAMVAVRNTTDELSNRAEELRVQSQAMVDEAQKQSAKATEELKQVALDAIEEVRAAAAETSPATDESTTEAA